MFTAPYQISAENSREMPRYLQFLALVSFRAFIKEGVDVAIYETHQGGKFDATNCIPRAVATAITPVDEDQMYQLGPSLENVAWHEAGIFKAGAPAFSAPQQLTATEVLRERAAEKGVGLKFVDVTLDLPAATRQPTPEVQLINFSLARAVSNRFLRQRAPQGNDTLLSDDVIRGLRAFSWPGRFSVSVRWPS